MKRNLVLLVITLVLAVLVLAVRWDDLFGPPVTATSAQDTATKASLPRVDATTIQAIEVRDTNGSITLRRGGDGWVVAEAKDYRANQERMQQFLDALADLDKAELRSSNADKQHLFETDAAKGRSVRVLGTGGTELVDLVIGKQDMAGRAVKDAGTFVRERSKPHTFSHGKRLQHLLYTSPALWTDTRMMPNVDPKEIQKVVDDATEMVLEFDDVDLGSMPAQPGVTAPARSGERVRVVLVADMIDTPVAPTNPDAAVGPDPAVKPPEAPKQQRRWSVKEPATAKDLDLYEAQIDGMVRQLVASRFESVAGKDIAAAEYGLTKPVGEFTLIAKDGTRRVLRFGAAVPPKEGQEQQPGTKARYATVEGAAWVFVVPEYVVTMLQKRPEELVPPAPPPEAATHAPGQPQPISLPPENENPPTDK